MSTDTLATGINAQTVVDAVAELLMVNSEKYPSYKLAHIKKHYTDTVKFIISSALLERYTAPRPKANSNTTIDDDNIREAIQLIGQFDANRYKKLPLILQQFIWLAGSVDNLPISRLVIVSSLNTLDHMDVISIIIHFGGSMHAPNIPSECNMCGGPYVVHNNPMVSEDSYICQMCIDKLLSTINFRSEDFILYGSSKNDFSIKVLNYTVKVVDKLFIFTKEPTSVYSYQPSLPFEEYQNNIALV